jgi:hypothetical protein
LKKTSEYPIGEVFRLWFVAWIGTVLAGGVFGALVGAVFGLLAGPFFAAFFGVPVVCTIAALSWALWLDRAIVLMAAIAGGLTGFIATAMVWDPIFMLEYGGSLVAASIIGALGAGLCTGWYSIRHSHGIAGNTFIAGVWHYSLRDLFWRFTVVAVLVAMWSLVIGRITGRIAN